MLAWVRVRVRDFDLGGMAAACMDVRLCPSRLRSVCECVHVCGVRVRGRPLVPPQARCSTRLQVLVWVSLLPVLQTEGNAHNQRMVPSEPWPLSTATKPISPYSPPAIIRFPARDWPICGSDPGTCGGRGPYCGSCSSPPRRRDGHAPTPPETSPVRDCESSSYLCLGLSGRRAFSTRSEAGRCFGLGGVACSRCFCCVSPIALALLRGLDWSPPSAQEFLSRLPFFSPPLPSLSPMSYLRFCGFVRRAC